MNKYEMRTSLDWRAARKELDLDGEMLGGLLNRSQDLQAALAHVLYTADMQAQSLVGVNLEDPIQRAHASKVQGQILGFRAAVDIILNCAYERSDEDAA